MDQPLGLAQQASAMPVPRCDGETDLLVLVVDDEDEAPEHLVHDGHRHLADPYLGAGSERCRRDWLPPAPAARARDAHPADNRDVDRGDLSGNPSASDTAALGLERRILSERTGVTSRRPLADVRCVATAEHGLESSRWDTSGTHVDATANKNPRFEAVAQSLGAGLFYYPRSG